MKNRRHLLFFRLSFIAFRSKFSQWAVIYIMSSHYSVCHEIIKLSNWCVELTGAVCIELWTSVSAQFVTYII